MINWDTLISSFDDPLTLLQWLIKLVEEQESQKVNNITLEYVDDEYYRIVLNYSDGTQVKSPLISKGEKYTLTLQDLQSKIEGSDFISFDINEQDTKLVISLDKTHVDDVVTEDSENLITSGAVFDAISGIEGDSKLVEVTYGVTSYNEVKAIVDSGKIPYCFYDSKCYKYQLIDNGYVFVSALRGNFYYIVVNTDGWYTTNTYCEISNNKKNTITPTSTTEYPSSKAVADYVSQHSDGGWQLLWENASPSSSFASQVFNVDTSQYSKFAIVFKTVSTATKMFFTEKANFTADNTASVNIFDFANYSVSNNLYKTNHRDIVINDNSISVGNNYLIALELSSANVTRETNNLYLIPYKIYGFN